MPKVWTYETGWREVSDEDLFLEEGRHLREGVYKLSDGRIYVVRLNRDKTKLQAKRLIETSSDRLTEDGKLVRYELKFDGVQLKEIGAEDLMDFKEAKELIIRYGRCIYCGHGLKVAKSVERGIGPVCFKAFGSVETELLEKPSCEEETVK